MMIYCESFLSLVIVRKSAVPGEIHFGKLKVDRGDRRR